MAFARCPADVLHDPLRRRFRVLGFLSHLHSLMVTMSQKSSIPQAAKSVSQALIPDSSFARMRSRRDFRWIWNLPRRDLLQMKVKPKKLKVSGLPSPRRSRIFDADRCAGTSGHVPDLPVPVKEASAHARVSDHAGLDETLRYRVRPYCVPQPIWRRHPELKRLSRLNGWPMLSPANASPDTSRCPTHD